MAQGISVYAQPPVPTRPRTLFLASTSAYAANIVMLHVETQRAERRKDFALTG